LIRYESPFNESIRTMLRLEHLFDRLGCLLGRDEAIDHHFALLTLFEIMDVSARADLKSDVLRDLERQRSHFNTYRDNPAIAQDRLVAVVEQIDHAFNGLNAHTGKAGNELNSNEWLMGIRSRISIPAGTCEFDLPSYYAWQQFPPAQRRSDLTKWVSTLMPLAESLKLLLGLLRESGTTQKVVALGGHYQQSLPIGRMYHLVRVRIDPSLELVPEINGHRLMVQVRLMAKDGDGRLRPSNQDASFELTLCA
jgi:cell division protein ZapD